MATRVAGVIATSALACVLVSTTLGTSYADDARARATSADGTCFGEAPTRELQPTENFSGTDAVDVVIGGNEVYGFGGDDLICGATYAEGGDGNDRIRVDGNNKALGGPGDDEFVAIAITGTSSAGAVLYGGSGNDVFWGSTLAETIIAGGGADVVWAGGGNDFVRLGKGNDQGAGQLGNDIFQGGEGDDVVDGGPGSDKFKGGTGVNRCQNVEDRYSCVVVR
jgi:Ca2+-binding RTX toxin-like protein